MKRYTGTQTDFYRAAPKVAETVNLAIALKRPILVEGEPGCGKTMLASSVAAELNALTNLHDLTPDHFVKITVKSTSRAQDLLYRLDALRRLQDSQNPNNANAQKIYPYLSLGALGRAIHSGKRTVVLIDEIDKADIDFPNDMLDVLDNFSFTVDDLPIEESDECAEVKGFGREVRAHPDHAPIIMITSNREKRLPEPFLRRCLYIRLRFPETVDELRDIVMKNIRDEEINDHILISAIEAFDRIRTAATRNEIQKPPTTSELIDWVKIIHWQGVGANALTEQKYQPPYWEVLFKNMPDLDAYDTFAKNQK